jgi:hypothetical protein
MRSTIRASASSAAPFAVPRRLRPRLLAAAAVGIVVAGMVSGAAGAASNSHYSPVGKAELIRQGKTGLYVRGWAYDQDTTAPAVVHLAVDHKRVATLHADAPRPDVAKTHPGHGTDLGFHYSGTIAAGKHTVCVRVVDYPTKKQVQLRCRTISFDFDPIGAVDGLTTTPGHLTATGWAIDPNDPASARGIIARIDDKPVAETTADQPYPSLAKSHPKAGDNHGFTLTFPISEGTHSVCIKATNIGPGTGHILRCYTRKVNFSPTGKITNLVQAPGGFRITGYAKDPDSTTPTRVWITTGGGTKLATVEADRAGGAEPGYGFYAHAKFLAGKLAPGNHTLCAKARNVGTYGENRTIQCVTKYFNWNPSVHIVSVKQQSPGASITGWAVDPDTTDPIQVKLFGDGKRLGTVTADGTKGSLPGHQFTGTVTLSNGKHTVCAVAVNAKYGAGNSPAKCATITLNFDPYGKYESLARAPKSNDIIASGWAIDPDSETRAVPIQVTVDGGKATTGSANLSRPDVAKAHAGTGSRHGFAVRVPADDGEHTVCVTAVNILGGSGATKLGCKIINAVHPVAPAAPSQVSAIAGYGGARIVWTAPTSDGGAPWTGYTITARPGGKSMTVGAGIASATLLGLKPSTKYSFSVVANNVAGASQPGTSPAVTTEKEPPPQTSPAPISTSRYIRNISGSSAADLARMRKEGAADAKANPSGHGYLTVLAVGGQSDSQHGVILSATIRFVSYTDMVKALNAYVDGYASQQRPSAPITLAIATNNDIDVSHSSGTSFANHIVDPVRAHASRYPGITIAGSDDMEPGFRGGYAATSAWLNGYLHGTHAPFVFTGSADGCSWTTANGGCNNGWTMRGMYHVAGGASPIRIINLPQIYNDTMAQQWRYISLTGVVHNQPRIDFGGALTEWTACRQAGSCGSLTGNSAWKQMWKQLNAEPKLKVNSLPYSTDLRIDS